MGLPDLHRHLDGSIRAATLQELADRDGIRLPAKLRFHAGMGLGPALELFAHTLSVLQSPDAVRRVAAEICEDAQAEGVSTLEIRFAPQLHQGAAPRRIVEAAVEGAAGRAGLILCGLYGEPPAVLDELVEIARTTPGVVAIDLAGGPSGDHTFKPDDYAPAFTRAKDLGIGRTVHAAEGRPAQEIRWAIEVLHAQRIGHGTTLTEDPGVVDLVLERGVVIEACPSSNLHTGVIPSLAAHPLGEWARLGVRACINTDNTFFSDVTSPEEHQRALQIDRVDRAVIDACVETGLASAFWKR